ncbi:MAG: CAP domain-containing protein, partial [Clostridia bacterium]|nr:CAP domain-containing protein [Clostridia bacterium]
SDGDEVIMNRNPLGVGALRDLFLPCVQNDYSPQILKPQRIIFHIVSLITVKLVLIVFILLYPLTAWLSPDISLAEAKKVIQLTNELRRKVNLGVLTENSRLEQAAWQKLQDMLINQYFAHINPSGQDLSYWINKAGYKYSVIGENLAMGYATAEDVVFAWAKSPTHYRNIVDRNFKETGVAIGDGRFKEGDTVFMVQYFGRPTLVKNNQSKTANTVASPKAKDINYPIGSAKIVKGDVAYASAENSNQENKFGTITINGDSLSDAKVLKAEIVLPPETVTATAVVNNHNLTLEKTTETNTWSGVGIINSEEEKEISSPLVPATLVIESKAGQVNNYQLNWSEIKPSKTSVWQRYFLFKNYPTNNMLPVLIFSNFYFKLALVVFSLATILNIVVKIKKQKVNLIASSLGIVCLIVLLLIF